MIMPETRTFDELQQDYKLMQTFTPFASSTDKRPQRDQTYYIFKNPITGNQIEIYVKKDDTFNLVAYGDFHQETLGEDYNIREYIDEKYFATKTIKLDYLFTHKDYRGLGLASMIIAQIQDECRLRQVGLFRLDSLKDPTIGKNGIYDKNHDMYINKGFEDFPYFVDSPKEKTIPMFQIIQEVESVKNLDMYITKNKQAQDPVM